MFLVGGQGIIKMRKENIELKSIIFNSHDTHISQRKTFNSLKSANIESSGDLDYYSVPFERSDVTFDEAADLITFSNQTTSNLQALYSGKNIEINFTLKTPNIATPKIGFTKLNQYNSTLLRLETFDFYFHVLNKSLYYASTTKNVSDTLITTLSENIDYKIKIVLEESNIYIYVNDAIILTLTEALFGYYKPAVLRNIPNTDGGIGADKLNEFRVIYYAPYPVGIDPLSRNISKSFATDSSLDYSEAEKIKRYKFDYNRNKQDGLTKSLIGNNLYIPKQSDSNSLDSVESNETVDISKILNDIYAFIPFHHSGCINASIDSTSFPLVNNYLGLAASETDIYAYNLYKASLLVTTSNDISKTTVYDSIQCIFRLDIDQNIAKRQPYDTKDLQLRIFSFNVEEQNNNSNLLYTASIHDYDILTILTMPTATKRVYTVLINGELIYSLDTPLTSYESTKQYGCFLRSDYGLSFSNITESPLFSFSTNITNMFNADKKYELLEERAYVNKLSKISESSGVYYDKLYYTNPYKTNLITFLADITQNNYIVYGPYAPKKDIVYSNNQFIEYENGTRNGNLLLKFYNKNIYIYTKNISGNMILYATLLNAFRNDDRITLYSSIDSNGIISVDIFRNEQNLYTAVNNIAVTTKLELIETSRTIYSNAITINYNVADLAIGDIISVNFSTAYELKYLNFNAVRNFKIKGAKNNNGIWYYNAIYVIAAADISNTYVSNRYLKFEATLSSQFTDVSQIKILSCSRDTFFMPAIYTDSINSSIKELQVLDPIGTNFDRYLWGDETIIPENKLGTLISTQPYLADQFPVNINLNGESLTHGYLLNRYKTDNYEYYYAYGSNRSHDYEAVLGTIDISTYIPSNAGVTVSLSAGVDVFKLFDTIYIGVYWSGYSTVRVDMGHISSTGGTITKYGVAGWGWTDISFVVEMTEITNTSCKISIYNLDTDEHRLSNFSIISETTHELDSDKLTPVYFKSIYSSYEKLDYSMLYKDNKCDTLLALSSASNLSTLNDANTFGIWRVNTTAPFTTNTYRIYSVEFNPAGTGYTLSYSFANIRYIRNVMNGSTINSNNHWVEIQVYDENNANVMSNLSVNNITTSIPKTDAEKQIINDGVLTTDPYLDLGGGEQFILIDLGSVKSVSRINLRHYFGDNREYNQKLQISYDNKVWTTIFDSDKEGRYAETPSGKDFINLFMAPGDRYGLEIEKVYYIDYNAKQIRVKQGIKGKYIKINNTKYFSTNNTTITIDNTPYTISSVYQIKKYIQNGNNRKYYDVSTTATQLSRTWAIMKNVYSFTTPYRDSKIYDPQIKIDYAED